MKRLLLMRHAKAEAAGTKDDHDRDLVARGVADAAEVGRQITTQHWRPDVALVSDARRTRRTFEALGLTHHPELRLEPALYNASTETVLDAIAATSPGVECLLVIGHNPSVAQAALRLAVAGKGAMRSRLTQGFPTATLAVIDLPAWDEVPAGGTIAHLLTRH